ncbi:MAG: carboxylesterase family protein [Planctomycetaceae bacterium]|nr:carboxylesterase family protein [Planctomycetaceae bacterium]
MRRGYLALFAMTIAISWSAHVCAPLALAGTVYIDPLYGFQKTTVQYATGATQAGKIPLLADIYQPTNIGNGPIPTNRPAIVFQDGGAWTSADRTNGRVVTAAVYLAQRGYTVIATDYRQGATAFGIPVGPHAPVIVGQTEFGTAPYNGITASGTVGLVGLPAFRAGIEDFAVAMDWTRDNAAALGINPNKIGIAGGSAGGIDALLLQYNNNPIDERYRAQAVVALVSTMMNNYTRIQPGGPPVFLLNNVSDAVVPWSPQMSQRFVDVGIYREQWYQPTNLTDHNVRWDDIPTLVPSATPATSGPNLLERVRDFLITSELATPYVVPEPSSIVLSAISLVAFGLVCRARRRRAA